MRKRLAEWLYPDRDQVMKNRDRRQATLMEGFALQNGNHPIIVDGYCAIDSLKMQLNDGHYRLDSMCLTHGKLSTMFMISKETDDGRKFLGTLPKSHHATPNIEIDLKVNDAEKVLSFDITLKHNFSNFLLEHMLRHILVYERLESVCYMMFDLVGVFRGDIVQYVTQELLMLMDLGFTFESGDDKKALIIKSKSPYAAQEEIS